MTFRELPTDNENAFLVLYIEDRRSDGTCSFVVDREGNLKIEVNASGLMGSVRIKHADFDGLIKYLPIAKQRIEELKIVDKLKGK